MPFVRTIIGLLIALHSLAHAPTTNAQPLTVATIERPPFAMQDDAGQWQGFSIELLSEIAQRTNQELAFVGNSAFADMIDSVREGNVDLAAANISITADRERQMDFTQPIYNSGLTILVPFVSTGGSLLKAIWKSGIVLFLGGAFLVLMVVAHLVWFFERGENAQHDYFRDEYLPGLWDAFWWAFIIVTMGGFEKERPEHYIGRVLAVFWVLTSLFFVSALTAQITTALTVAQLSRDIESVDDLRGKNVGAPVGTTISAYLDRNRINYRPFDDFTDALRALEAGELQAVVGSAAVSQFYANGDGKGLVATVGGVFAPDSLGFAFPQGSELLEPINTTLLEMKEDGSFGRIRERYFGVE